jgi:hypothetical protein
MDIGKIGDYVKAHPWIAGGVVIGGGLIFLVLSGWLGGGSGASTGGNSSATGPSDTQIAANAAIAEQTIGAQVAALQSNNQVALGNIAANIQAQHDADALQLGLATVNASEQVNLAGITAQQAVQAQSIAAQQTVAVHQIDEQQYVASQAAAIQTQQIQANITMQQSSNNLVEDLIKAFTPAPTPTPSPTPAPAQPQYTSIYDPGAVQDYLAKNPDVATVDYSHESAVKGDTREQFAIWHYQNYGQAEGRQL